MSARRALNILMTTDAVGGVWQYATDLSAALISRGHRVTLAVMGPPPSSDQRRHVKRVGGLDVIETGLPLDWMVDGPAPVVQSANAIARLAKDAGADLVHCNMPTLAGAAEFQVPVVAVTHGCVATWWQAAKNEPLALAFRWHRSMMGEGLTAAHAIVAPSGSYAATIKRTYRLRFLPRVVHNGRQAALPGTTRAEPARCAITAGRMWDSVKNAALLDEVAANLHVPFLAAGAQQGPHGESISLRHLEAVGHLDNASLAALLAKRPVFVSAASFEPFGLAVLEAASAGCALVLSDIPTFRELWDGAALFGDPRDPHAFTAAVRAVMANPERRHALGAAAARRAARFTPASAADAMSSIYREVLGEREAAA